MPPPSLDADFADHQRPVSNNPSRKQFLAKLAGLFAVAGLAPKLLAKRPVAADGGLGASAPAIKIEPDARAVARRDSMV